MGNLDVIIDLRKKLEKIVDDPDDPYIKDNAKEALVHIDTLKKEDMSLKLLLKTKIGFTVNNLRKASKDETVQKSAKSLLKKWKELDQSDTGSDKKSDKKKSDKPKVSKEESKENFEKSAIAEFEISAPVPTRNKHGVFEFEDYPEFQPNLSPKEVLALGSFGGTYFRPIYSGVTKQKYGSEVWKELPQDWLQGLNIKSQVSCPVYDNNRNKYGVKCGASLEEWESSGWMHKQDPYGWFQWYCRFYQGRRTEDDARQVGRWARCAGATGRWKNNLISKIVKAGCGWDNHGVSPVVRQTLQHWGYRLTEKDFEKNKKKFMK